MIDFFHLHSSDKHATGNAETGNITSMEKIAEIIHAFPIGMRLHFFPEYREELLLESIIIGYKINRHFIHNQHEITIETEAGRPRLYLDVDSKLERQNGIDEFAFLLPRENESTNKLDINRKAELQHIGTFRPGNTITLVSSPQAHGSLSVETEVRRLITLKSGVYAHNDAAVLDLTPNTLRYTEPHHHVRLYTNIPATLHTTTGEEKYQVSLKDFSEGHLRVAFDASSPLGRVAQLGKDMILDLPLPECKQYYVLQGKIFKLAEDSLVLKTEQYMVNGKMAHLGLIDALSIKSTLLDHPATEHENQGPE